jgi:hypothetical protein
MAASGSPRHVAVVFREPVGTAPAPVASSGLDPRLVPMVEALNRHDLAVVRVPYAEGREAETSEALTDVDAILVWADPVSDHGDRHRLDGVLRRAADAGAWVSAHPDTVDRLATKEVLVTTRHLPWGSDAHLYRTSEELHTQFPGRLASSGVRVLKATRGNGGRTVWKVRLPDGPSSHPPRPSDPVVVQHARVRDGSSQTTQLAELLATCASAFSAWGGAGAVVDQEFVGGITRGIVRCYLVGSDVVGFARQYPTGAVPVGPLHVARGSGQPAEDVMGLPSPKTMYPPTEPGFAGLRSLLEDQWVPGAVEALGLAPDHLPALWGIDLLIADPSHGPGDPGPRFVLCEINASSVIPYPPEAPNRVAVLIAKRLAQPLPRD